MKKNFKSNYYARALFEISRAEATIERSEEELRQLKAAILSNIDLKKYLTDPSIDKNEKIKSLINILGGDACPAISAFSSMLVLLDAVEQIEQIYDDYSEITSEFKKQVSVDVVSAIDLDGSILDTIKKEVDSKTGLDVRIRNISDADIIGGIVIKIGDRVIDLSVKNKIEDLRNKLKAIDLRSEEFGTEN